MKKLMILVLVLCVGASAHALTSVDFQRDGGTLMSGAGPGGWGAAGDVWNDYTVTPAGWVEVFDDHPMSNLVDSTGAATGVDLALTGAGGAFNVGGATDVTADGIYAYPGLVGYTYEGYYNDPQYQTTMTDSIEWELSGLTAGGSYQMANYGGPVTGYTIDMTIDTDGDGDLLDETAFTVAGETATITSITAGAGGSIIGSFTTSAGVNEGHWSGFQLIPEPATVCLLGVGGLLLRRRRS